LRFSLRRGEEREQGDKSGEEAVNAEDFVFHGVWREARWAVSSRQLAGFGSWKKSWRKVGRIGKFSVGSWQYQLTKVCLPWGYLRFISFGCQLRDLRIRRLEIGSRRKKQHVVCRKWQRAVISAKHPNCSARIT
jgi:hypothetical protein